MSKPEKSIREQLLEARDRLRRQLEILPPRPSMGRGSPDDREVIQHLKNTLGEIEQALADLGPDNA